MKELLKDKEKRQRAIRRIVSKSKVSSQEELIERLGNEGISSTQATLSRDLKEMDIVKMHGEDGSSYYSVSIDFLRVIPETGAAHILSGIAGLEFSGQLAVVKTRPGYANMVGAVIDSKLSGYIMGTIAGDDTLAIFLRQGADIAEIRSLLEASIPGISAKIID